MKVTEVHVGSARISEWGHISYDEAINRARKHFLHQRTQAINALKDIEGGKTRVFHQLNLHAVRNRREVKP